jgi:nucleoside diphosphate kinase
MEAQEGTIRRDFSTKEERELFQQGKTVKNLIHASDSKKSAEFEINLLFNEK